MELAPYSVPVPLFRLLYSILYRGRNGHYWPPPARIRTCRITAYGSYLEYRRSESNKVSGTEMLILMVVRRMVGANSSRTKCQKAGEWKMHHCFRVNKKVVLTTRYEPTIPTVQRTSRSNSQGRNEVESLEPCQINPKRPEGPAVLFRTAGVEQSPRF